MKLPKLYNLQTNLLTVYRSHELTYTEQQFWIIVSISDGWIDPCCLNVGMVKLDYIQSAPSHYEYEMMFDL